MSDSTQPIDTPQTSSFGGESAPSEGFNMAAFAQALNEAWQRSSQEHTETLRLLGAAIERVSNNQEVAPKPRGTGPKPKEPSRYDGDRTDGKLDDHIRDVENWIRFHERRNHWGDETEKVEQAATYLTGKMHRMYDLSRASIATFPEYIAWLRETFKDSNENIKLKEEWRCCTQGSRTVMDYATDLIYLAQRIVPRKLDAEIKDHFRTGLSPRIQLRLAEHPEYENNNLSDYIGRADTLYQIELAKDHVRQQAGGSQHMLYGIKPTEDHAESEDLEDVYDRETETFYTLRDPRRGTDVLGMSSGNLRKGTPQWSDWCKANEACFNCAKKGHRTRDCAQPRATLNKPQYNIKRDRYAPRAAPPGRGQGQSSRFRRGGKAPSGKEQA
jgi:hypothetical protein